MSREHPKNRSSEAENTYASCTQTSSTSVQRDQKKDSSDELRVRLEKQRQDHIVALQGKNEELTAKQNEIAKLKDENYKLKALNSAVTLEKDELQAENKALLLDRERKHELQTEVCDLNEKLNKKSALDRDYEACLNKICKLTAERDTLREDREEQYEKARRFKEQVEDQAKVLDNERKKNEALQSSLLNFIHEIQKLTQESTEWKERYEELKNRTENDQKTKDKSNLWFHKAVGGGTNGNEDSASGDHERSARQSNREIAKTAKRPKQDEHYSEQDHDSGVSFASGVSDQPRPRKRFHTVRSKIPCCKNCGIVFHEQNLLATECRFHRVQPQSYEVWTKLRNQDTVRVNPRLRSHLFWPCCESHGRNTPEGCMVLRHHEIVYPDE